MFNDGFGPGADEQNETNAIDDEKKNSIFRSNGTA